VVLHYMVNIIIANVFFCLSVFWLKMHNVHQVEPNLFVYIGLKR